MSEKNSLKRQIANPFLDSLKVLGISDYADQIWHSNSRGELFFITDYIQMANAVSKWPDPKLFRPMFVHAVESTEKTWARPESCFQHMPKLIIQIIEGAPASDNPEKK